MFFTLFTLHLNTNIWTFLFLTFSKQACYCSELSIIFILCRCTFTSQHHKTDFNLRRTERETAVWRKGVLVFHICRDSAALCLEFLIFSLCCCSGRFTNPKCCYVTSWDWDSTINSRLRTSGTNRTDASFKFNSLWITLLKISQGYFRVSLDCVFLWLIWFFYTHHLTDSLIKKNSQDLSVFVFANITSNKRCSSQQMLEDSQWNKEASKLYLLKLTGPFWSHAIRGEKREFWTNCRTEVNCSSSPRLWQANVHL